MVPFDQAQANPTRAMDEIKAWCSRLSARELDDVARFAQLLALELRVARLEADAGADSGFLAEAAAMPLGAHDYRTLARLMEIITDIPRAALLRPRRGRPETKARQILWWLCAACTTKSTKEIARLSGRTHTTVLHGIGRAEAAREAHGLSGLPSAVAWALALWNADWPPAYDPDGRRTPRTRTINAAAPAHLPQHRSDHV